MMRVEEAKLMSDNANQLKETLSVELSKIYEYIKENALLGLYTTNIHKGYLNGSDYRSKYLEQSIVDSLENNGYYVTRCYDNPNNLFLTVSWLKWHSKHVVEAS